MSDELDYEKWWARFQLICKPEQSGKTFVMIQQIISDLTQPMKKEMINIILCDNNLLLTKQTSTRVENDLKSYINGGITYVELSSHSRTEYHDIKSIFHAVVAKGVRNVICCTNNKRMHDCESLVRDINSCQFLKDKFHFTIWMDEADKFTKFINCVLKPLVEVNSNVDVKLITATPKPLFDEYNIINVFPIENTTSELYHGWLDYENIRIFEKNGNYLDFANHILNTFHSYIVPGTKWFIPALTEKKSHVAMMELCLDKGMAVIIVNGDGLSLYLPTREKIIIKKGTDLNSHFIKLYESYHLSRYPLALSGNLCISRGSTIMSESFMITHAILSHCSDKNEVSQLSGRVKGNIKGFANYPTILPTIFTTQQFHSIASIWEKKSRTLGKLAFVKEENGEDTMISKQEFKSCGIESEFEITALFQDKNELRIYLDSIRVQGKITGYGLSRENTIQSRGETIPLHDFKDKVSFMRKDIYLGLNKEVGPTLISCRMMPVFHDDKINWIGIYVKKAFL
jgi:hypothetical protein